MRIVWLPNFFWGDEIEKITEVNPLTGELVTTLDEIAIIRRALYHRRIRIKQAIVDIETELEERIKYFKDNNRLLEAQRIEQRTKFDIEMIKEIGYCSGIENYSRHLDQRPAGSHPGH